MLKTVFPTKTSFAGCINSGPVCLTMLLTVLLVTLNNGTDKVGI